MSMWWGLEVLEEALEPLGPFRRGPVPIVSNPSTQATVPSWKGNIQVFQWSETNSELAVVPSVTTAPLAEAYLGVRQYVELWAGVISQQPH